MTVWDNSKVKSTDLASQFYFSEQDLGKNRADACRDSLQELNAAVSVSSSQEDLSKSFLGKFEVTLLLVLQCHLIAAMCKHLSIAGSLVTVLVWWNITIMMHTHFHDGSSSECIMSLPPSSPDAFLQVVVMTDSPLAEAKRVNDICHQNNTAFILASVRGVFGQVFTDFGSDFTVFDTDGKPLSVYSWRLKTVTASLQYAAQVHAANHCMALGCQISNDSRISVVLWLLSKSCQ